MPDPALFPPKLENNSMSARFKDDSYRLPHYGRDGVVPDWSGGWNPPKFPDLPPAAPVPVMPGSPVIPGLPWWVDPWMPRALQPLPPEPQSRRLPEQPAPNVLAGPARIGSADGLLGLLQGVMLRNKAQKGPAEPAPMRIPSVNGGRASSGDLLIGRVSGQPMHHFMIPIFET